jgi:hypothetical protein
MYLTKYNPPEYAKTPCHCRHARYTTSKLVTCDCHPKQKNATKEISNPNPQEITFQTFHFRISSDYFSTFYMLPKILPLLSSSMKRYKRPCLL